MLAAIVAQIRDKEEEKRYSIASEVEEEIVEVGLRTSLLYLCVILYNHKYIYHLNIFSLSVLFEYNLFSTSYFSSLSITDSAAFFLKYAVYNAFFKIKNTS